VENAYIADSTMGFVSDQGAIVGTELLDREQLHRQSENALSTDPNLTEFEFFLDQVVDEQTSVLHS